MMNSVIGTAVMSLVLTYVMQIYNALFPWVLASTGLL
jgi:hypothetical protein